MSKKEEELKKGMKNNMNNFEARYNDIQLIHIDDIKKNPYQPRQQFDEKSIQELALSIQNDGLLQPITINQNNILIYGERRFRAIKYLERQTIKAIIRNTNDDTELEYLAIIENLQREDLSDYDTALAVVRLVKTIGKGAVPRKIGKSPSYVNNRIKAIKIIEDNNLPKEIFNLNEILNYGKPKKEVGNKNTDTEIKKSLSTESFDEFEYETDRNKYFKQIETNKLPYKNQENLVTEKKENLSLEEQEIQFTFKRIRTILRNKKHSSKFINALNFLVLEYEDLTRIAK